MIDEYSSRTDVLAAVKKDGLLLEFASAELQADRDVVLAAVAQNGWALMYASANLRDSREVVLAAVAQNGFALQFASFELRADREVVLAAVAEHGWALEYASAKLKADREFILAAVAQNCRVLRLASAELRADREFILATVAQNGDALRYASAELRADREVVLAAVAQNGWTLEYASAELRAGREVVLAAVAKNGWALQFASAELKDNREVVLAAVAQTDEALRYASAELRADRAVVSVAERDGKHIGIQLMAILNNPSLIQFFPTISDEKIKTFFEKIDCRAKMLTLPTYIDKNSLDKIQRFIEAQENNHFTVRLPNGDEIDYKFRTSLAEQMLGAINWQSSSELESELEPEPEPEPRHRGIFFNDANRCRQFNPIYFDEKQISFNQFMLPVLREVVVSKIPEALLSMLFGLRLQVLTECLFKHFTIKDLSKYMQVCKAMRRGIFIRDAVRGQADGNQVKKRLRAAALSKGS